MSASQRVEGREGRCGAISAAWRTVDEGGAMHVGSREGPRVAQIKGLRPEGVGRRSPSGGRAKNQEVTTRYG